MTKINCTKLHSYRFYTIGLVKTKFLLPLVEHLGIGIFVDEQIMVMYMYCVYNIQCT